MSEKGSKNVEKVGKCKQIHRIAEETERTEKSKKKDFLTPKIKQRRKIHFRISNGSKQSNCLFLDLKGKKINEICKTVFFVVKTNQEVTSNGNCICVIRQHGRMCDDEVVVRDK